MSMYELEKISVFSIQSHIVEVRENQGTTTSVKIIYFNFETTYQNGAAPGCHLHWQVLPY